MIDTELRLYGDEANAFRNIMRSVDRDSILLRDEFVDGVYSDEDENGVLTINCSDLDLDLSGLDEKVEPPEVLMASCKDGRYTDTIDVNYSYEYTKTRHNQDFITKSFYRYSDNWANEGSGMGYDLGSSNRDFYGYLNNSTAQNQNVLLQYAA